MHIGKSRALNSGTTLPEVLVAAVLAAVFFGTIFEVNAVCLHYISGSKENVTAIECVQDRIEVLRNSSFSTVTDQTAMTTLLTTPANAAVLAQSATETVTISTFANGAATTPKIVFSRNPGASVTPTYTWTGGPGFGTASVVRVDVQYVWTSMFGARSRTEQSSTIVCDGTKK
jgi:hypothetical protein